MIPPPYPPVCVLAGAAAFTPADLPGLTGRWEGAVPSTYFLDAARTTPATLGNSVQGVADSSGSGNHLTQPTAAVVTVVNGPNSHPALSGGWLKKDGIKVTGAGAQYSFAAVVRADAASNHAALMFSGSGAFDGAWLLGGTTPSAFRGSTDLAPALVTVPAGTSSQWRLYVGVWGASGGARNVGFWVDGEGIGSGVAALPAEDPSSADLRVGCVNDGSFPLDIPFAAAWYANAAWTGADVRNLAAYCQSVYGTGSYTPGPLVLCSGNSICKGTAAGTSNYPTQLAASLAGFGGYVVKNLGIDGQTTDQMLAADPGRIWPFCSSAEPHILISNEGTNTLQNGASAADTTTKLTALYAGYRTAGIAAKRIVVVTVLPGGIVNNTDRATVNTALRALCTAQGYTLCDWAADATMGPDGANANATYYPDGLHPSAAGYAILAGIADAAVRVAAA